MRDMQFGILRFLDSAIERSVLCAERERCEGRGGGGFEFFDHDFLSSFFFLFPILFDLVTLW